MDEDNVWSAAAEPSPLRDRHGQGWWINQAFSLDVVLRYAFAVVREQPVLVLGIGALLFVVFNLPTLLGLPGDFTLGALEGTGQLDELTLALLDVANSLMQLGLTLLFWPLQWWIATGAIAAIAHYTRTGEVSWALVFTSGRALLKVLGYRLLVVLIEMLVLGLAMLPVGVVVGVAVAVDQLVIAGVSLIVGGLFALFVWLYLHLPLALGTLAIAVDDVGPIEALRIAWEAGSGARMTLFVVALVYVVGSIVGLCLFCVGQAPVMGLGVAGVTVGWLIYSRPEDELKQWPFFRRNPLL